MPRDFLHNDPEFSDLIRIVAEEKGIDPALVEKDYWIMHCLYGLQQLGYTFQLKGGTSLSKGHQIIGRFSEDIDILIEPPADGNVKTGKNQNKPAQVQTRKDFYDWLARSIKIDGISTVERDTTFDDVPNYRSAGIKLNYKTTVEAMEGLREGVLLEVGFDTVAPNAPKDIGSWVYDDAADKLMSSTTARRPCLAMTPPTPLLKSCKRFPRSFASSKPTEAIPSSSCATIMISTNCSNSLQSRNLLVPTLTRRISRRASARVISRTLQRTRRSF
jgi:hypothetical protein